MINRCNNCKECLGKRCDIYRSREFKKAWDKLINTTAHELKIYKILDSINEILSKK